MENAPGNNFRDILSFFERILGFSLSGDWYGGGMVKKRLSEFINKARKQYKNVGPISCPAFDGDIIYFTDRGFKHLMYKKGVPRSRKEQSRRMRLMPSARIVIGQAENICEYREIVRDDSIVRFWALEEVVNYKMIRVVIRQINREPKHFFSIMDKKSAVYTKSP